MKFKTFIILMSSLIMHFYSAIAQNTQNWQLSQQYRPADVRGSNLFGNAVDLDGNYAIASAHRQNHILNDSTIKQAGAVYMYEKEATGNWNEVQKLSAPDGAAYDYFGIDVGLSGSTAVIGAHYNSSDVNNQNPMPAAGAVYVFERDVTGIWKFWQKLTASDRDTLDWFGQSLSIHKNSLIVSATGCNVEEVAVGAAYYFKKNNEGYWVEHQIIKPPDKAPFKQFGTSMHFKENVLVIGVPFDSSTLPTEIGSEIFNQFYLNHGSAYIYEK